MIGVTNGPARPTTNIKAPSTSVISEKRIDELASALFMEIEQQRKILREKGESMHDEVRQERDLLQREFEV